MNTLISILNNPGVQWALLVFGFVMPVASLLTWAERRQSAMMQDRLGPNRANLRGLAHWTGKKAPFRLKGILHFIADALKMIFKEDFIPGRAHRGLFNLAPILALAPVLVAVSIIPFGPDVYLKDLFWVYDSVNNPSQTTPSGESISLQVLAIDWGLLFYFAILTVANYGSTIAGWASYNKWALLGGLRSSSQMMSYEVAMGLSLMGVFLMYGSLEPGYMVDQQTLFQNWGIFGAGNMWNGLPILAPCAILAFLLFFVSSIAETKRGPFDLPEGEPEIIGYFVEYSGMRWGMFFLAEFIEIVFVAMVISTVFFGGYSIGVPTTQLALPHIAVVALQLLAFGGKVVFFCWLQLAIRWTLPRFRPDQLMSLGWKRLLPFSLANLMVISLLYLLTSRGF